MFFFNDSFFSSFLLPQGFVCLSSLGSHLWGGGVPSPDSLPFRQALPEQPNALLRGGGHCHRYLIVVNMYEEQFSQKTQKYEY